MVFEERISLSKQWKTKEAYLTKVSIFAIAFGDTREKKNFRAKFTHCLACSRVSYVTFTTAVSLSVFTAEKIRECK